MTLVNNKHPAENKALQTIDSEDFFEQVEPFMELIMKYNCALREIETKFQVLNDEFTVKHNRNPVERIKTRVKKPLSIIDKLKRKNLPLTIDAIQNCINDVAGIRIICPYIDDIYSLVDIFAKQDDIVIVELKDYINNPKPNGYRSLHLIVEVPIFLSDRKENIRIEIQFRTMAMDFWASLEHTLKYKKDIEDSEEISCQLKKCADDTYAIDLQMQNIRKRIEG